MSIPDMRWSARECVARAKALLEKGDEPSARYACLELRSAIEFLAYDNLQTYREEMLDEVAKKWQPRELIAAMRDLDPHADMGGELRVALSGFGKELCKISGDVSDLHGGHRRESEFFSGGWGDLIEAKFIAA